MARDDPAPAQPARARRADDLSDDVPAHEDLCVTRVPIFQGLTRREQIEAAGFARPVTVAKGGTVYAPGQPVSRLLVVHGGRLKISHLAPGGQEQIVRTVSEGDVVGERAFLTGHRPDHFAVALEDSRMCVFDHRDLATLLRAYPDIGLRMLRTLSDRLASAERLLAAITSSDVMARVAAYLLDLPRSRWTARPWSGCRWRRRTSPPISARRRRRSAAPSPRWPRTAPSSCAGAATS